VHGAKITFAGKTLTASGWVRERPELNLSASALSRRLRRGWSVRRSLTEPMITRPKARAKVKRSAPPRNGTGEPAPEPDPASTQRAASDETLAGRIALIAALVASGADVDAKNRALLTRPDAAAAITPMRKVLAALVAAEPDLSSLVVAGELTLRKAHRRASERARKRKTPPPPPEKPSAPAVRISLPVFSPSDPVEYQGETLPLAAWASRRGDATWRPLAAQLASGMTMDEAMRHGAR
jgi:hypothetical protein